MKMGSPAVHVRLHFEDLRHAKVPGPVHSLVQLGGEGGSPLAVVP